ncbi:MAG: bifunctional DNA-formamidopyrimidine glycosylase/DNA-(apurinic or apyrimidinic site) lyase [Holophagales bacterium]|nr:bifunctional DNA-formamidopyrimidine glycosylase/DNA-(apurinic or apyrimidinic site) lyase [Holophagales bacterium]MYG32304.1 bifunctional DNA-formamidopyrimidine glycosylase/DNA-(apurinic or apyrimidinic site) lyase [Holophagales bacterium]MYI78527.1 bifunctional DNA-formamidopyrimidine glycosylase/DNA-(apurinic or apyrimidinic site) lyase [Holophagales bacterium]
MPELPEVEVLRRSLERPLVGDRFEAVRVHFPTLREPLCERRLRRLEGRRVVGLRRRAKYLWIDASGGQTLVVHLGMSGRLTLVDRAAPVADHEHLGFELASGRRLRFRDPRRFGVAFVVSTEGLDRDRHFRHLGVEPLSPGFDGARLAELARGRTAPVKSFLMDASVVVGVGNIYASEALYRARIHPRRSVARIARRRFDVLAVAVREVLGEAIEQGGTTLNDFADGEGNSGYFQVSLDVYDREGEVCPADCGAGIRRIVISNRSTYYCPRCQR